MGMIRAPFIESEVAAATYHIAGRIPAGEAAKNVFGMVSPPFPHDPDALRRKVAFFFDFSEVHRLPWADGEVAEESYRFEASNHEARMFSGQQEGAKEVMRERLYRAASMPLSEIELQMALTVVSLSKPLGRLIIREDDGTIRRIFAEEKEAIQELIGYLFDLPAVAM